MNHKELLENVNLSSFVAFDFETTGLDPALDRIIEIAAIRFVNGEPTDRFVTLINPDQNISPVITKITGITNQMVANKPFEKEIVDEFIDFIGEDPLVAHNINFDKSFLDALCLRFGKKESTSKMFDTLQLARSLAFSEAVFNLGSISEFYGLSSSGSHRAEKDTENCGEIFLYLLDELASYPLETITNVLNLIRNSSIPNKSLYEDLASLMSSKGALDGGLSQSKIEHNLKANTFNAQGKNNIENIEVNDVFGEDGIFKQKYEKFEYRFNQVKFAEYVEDSLCNDRGIGVVEAGTGLGKTIAYLFAALKKSSKIDTEGPTVVSCNTKHLQDQLFYKDLPQLVNLAEIPFNAVMIKGRNNYICRTRFEWLLAQSDTMDDSDIEALIPIVFWLYRTKTGDISECNGFFNSRRTWLQSLFSSEPGFCTGEACAKHRGCYYGKLRQAVFKAHIIVINHSLLLIEAAGANLLPDFNSIIIDEAHNLIKSAYDQYRIEFSEKNISFLLQTSDPSHSRNLRWNSILMKIGDKEPAIKGLRNDLKDMVGSAQSSLKNFMIAIRDENEHFFDPEKSYQEKPIIRNIEKIYAPVNTELEELKSDLVKISQSLNNIKKTILEIDPTREKYRVLHKTIERQGEINSLIFDNIMLLTDNQDPNWVYWFEGEFKRFGPKSQSLDISLHASLIDVGRKLNQTLFQKLDHCLLTSATLKVNDSFEYFLSRNGLNMHTNVHKKDFISPFFYSDQVTYYQYGGGKDLSKEPQAMADMIYYLHQNFQKRMMVLFTSRKSLADTAEALKNKKGGSRLPLFAQTSGASRPGIIRGMHQYDNGILFGTNSFWEGVDLPGELLEILVLVKLPFDVPSDPLVKSYSDFISSTGGNSFMEFSLPECAIRFRQGFGRLIRTTSDTGKFICFDNRIISKRYGEIFYKFLPVEMNPFSEITTIR